MKVTIRSVAKLAGVAPSTVSHYLNRTAPISPSTAQNVKQAIAALNYRVDLGARGLRSRKTLSVGLVIPNITTPFFGELAAIVENAFWEHGYQTLLCISERDVEREYLQFANLASRQVDGILMVYNSEQSRIAERAFESPVPIVFLDRPVPDQFSVATDNYFGGRLAARHLAELGHRRVGLLCGEPEIRNVHERIAGFSDEFTLVGIQPDPEYIVNGRQELQLGLRALELMQKQPPPTALFATNDIVAIGAWRTLIAAGYRIPEDVSLIGFDDVELSRFLSPPLTTVGQASGQMGRQAVRLLLERIAAKDHPGPSVPEAKVIPPQLHVRASTAAPRKS